MTWLMSAEGAEPTEHATEAEAQAAATMHAQGRKYVVWEIEEDL